MARELRIVVTADTAQADRNLAGTETKVQGVTKATSDLDTKLSNATGSISAASLAAAGLTAAFVVERIVGYANKVLEFADRMQDLSQQTGIGVEALQRFDFVAIGAGTTVEVLAEAFGRMTARLSGGDSGAIRGMELLGLNVQRFLALSPEERIFAVADASSKLGDETQRNQALYELFGRRFMELTPLMTAQMRELANHAPIISEDELQSIARFHDLLDQGSRTLMVWSANAIDAAKSAFLMNQQSEDIERLDKSTKKFIDTQVQQLDIYNQLVPPLKDYTLKGVELKIVQDDLTASIKNSIKGHEDHEKAIRREVVEVDKAAAAYRQYTNWIEERYIDTIKQQIALSEQQREELNKLSTAMGNYLGDLQKQNEAAQASLDAQDAAWRQHTNMIGELLMEQDRAAMTATQSMRQYFSDMFADIGQGVGTLLGMIGDALGRQFHGIMRGFEEAWHNGRSVVQGVLKGLSGDFSGWVQAIMGGIGLVRAAWNGLKSLFGGGEEGTVVNPARDTFLSQWGDPSKKGVGGAGWNLAAILTELGAGEGGGAIFSALQNAETMAVFRPAAQAIVEFLTSHGRDASMNFAVGGMVPRDGLAMIHQGEGVLTPRGVSAVGGPDAVQALNRGFAMGGVESRLDRMSDAVQGLVITLTQQGEQYPRAAAQEAMLARGRRLAHV